MAKTVILRLEDGFAMAVLPASQHVEMRELRRQLLLRVVDQQAVFQVQVEGARIEVVAGDQHVALVQPQPFQVVAVGLVPPQSQA